MQKPTVGGQHNLYWIQQNWHFVNPRKNILHLHLLQSAESLTSCPHSNNSEKIKSALEVEKWRIAEANIFYQSLDTKNTRVARKTVIGKRATFLEGLALGSHG